MKKYLVILVSFFAVSVQAQTIQVPNNVYFADIHMNIEESARVLIQKNVDYLLKYPTYFQQKVDRADTYFPIIERVFRESGVPEDFKYLALQESGLVSDAVSKSKAVGFWQFKPEAASDFGLKVNQQVDERRHILEASRSAAKYFKQSNTYYKNWANSLVSYYMGFTGAKAYARPGDAGSQNMTISGKTHVYLLTFLAHKIAFENAVGKNAAPAITLKEMRANPGQSLGEIALALQTDPVELEKYNKWLLNGTVPADKDYTVIIPVSNANTTAIAMNTTKPAAVILTDEPKQTTVVFSGKNSETGKLNGLNVIYAQTADTKDKLALQAKISTKKFLKFNDLHGFEEMIPGQAYYTEKKNKKATVENHTALPNETLWSIAQKYGVQLKTILTKNRMKKNESLVAGRVLWLQETRSAKIAVEYRNVEVPVNPKTPAPLTPVVASETIRPAKEIIMETNVVTSETEIKTQPAAANRNITETASATLRRAGKALQVKPEPAKVAEVSTETMDLPAPKATEAINPTEAANAAITETAAISPTDVLIESKNVENETPVAVQTEVPAISVDAKPELTPEKPVTETPNTLYPKSETVAVPETKTEPEYQKVVLREPGTKPASTNVKSTDAATDIFVAVSHKVVKGETLYAIARKYAISASDLKTWNKLGDKPLAIGQELTLKAPAEDKKSNQITAKSAPVAILVMETPAQTKTSIPVSAAENKETVITHKVGSGESMYQISRKYGVSIKEIMEWNNKGDFNVSAGDELIVKSKAGSSLN